MTQAKCSKLYYLLILFIASVTSSIQAQISVTGAGAGPLTFDATPAATEFATAVLTGTATTYTDATTMDAGAQTVDASTVTTTLPTSGTVPPSAFSGGMRHNTAAFYLQSRPTTDGTNAAGVMKATLQNDTGGGVLSFMVSYDFGINNLLAGEIPGFRVYYSLTGSPGSWQVIPSLSDSETAGTHSATVTVGSWSPGTPMYLLWADDNANGITDPSYTIDNFTISAITPDTLTCVAITNQSLSITVPERGSASFSIMATGSPQFIQWFQNGAPISGANGPSYTIPSVAYPTDDAAQFQAIVTNSLCAETSTVVTLTVIPDTTPPTVIRAVADADPTLVRVTFSEPMD
ncbi:MAG TPA: hypothetical protein VNT99_17680, partial [Methylomirabilota bacterium]|nr:hypothetical protein [Methylomirabilota bacterium]